MEFNTDTLRYHHTSDHHPAAEWFCRHSHPQYEVLFFYGGDARCVIEHREHHLKAGDLLLIPPLHYHFIKIESPVPYERAVLNFSECGARKTVLDEVFAEPRVLSLANDPLIPAVFERLDTLLSAFSGEDAAVLAGNLLTELIYLLSRQSGNDHRFTVYYNETLRAALRYIEDNLTTIRTAEEIAEALFISRSQLYLCFKDAFGIPPMKYILEKRLALAASRIALGEKPTTAAIACGFNEYSAFYRAYKKHYGHGPKK